MDPMPLPINSFPLSGMEAPPPPPKEDTAPIDKVCGNCHKDLTNANASRCSICKKRFYCNRDCQVSDWKFHKRVCEKPKATPSPAPTPPAQQPVEKESPKESTPTPKPAPVLTDGHSHEVELDEEDLAAIAEVKKRGYRHFTTKETYEKVAQEIQQVTGQTIQPKKLDSSPQPVRVEAQQSATAASEWNIGGTVEQKSYGPWTLDKLVENLNAAKKEGKLQVPVAGSEFGGGAMLVVSGIKDHEEASAEIIISRGKARKIYDMSFSVVVDVRKKDEYDEAAVTNEPVELIKGKEKKKDDDVKEKEEKKDSPAARYPQVILHFPDISNSSADDAESGGRGREVQMRFSKKPSFTSSEADAARLACSVQNLDSGLVHEIRKAIEQAVQAFLAL